MWFEVPGCPSQRNADLSSQLCAHVCSQTAQILRSSTPHRANSSKEHRNALVGLALGTFGLYAGLALLLDASGAQRQEHMRRLVVWPSVSLLTFFYYLGYRHVRDGGTSGGMLRITAVASLCFAMACLLMPPFDSLDLYGYVNKVGSSTIMGSIPMCRPSIACHSGRPIPCSPTY